MKYFNVCKIFLRNFIPAYYYDVEKHKKINIKKELVKPRGDGISGFMRLRNEEEFMGKVIDSIIDYFDELVIVYNRCTDNTAKIAKNYQKKYPDKIKVYHYEPYVFPQGTLEHSCVSPSSKHSLVNYYNFALAKTTKKIAVKIDGDDLFMDKWIKKTTGDIKRNGLKYPLGFLGVNLWDENGKLYVNKDWPFMGGGDRFFFYVTKHTYHIRCPKFELFTIYIPKKSNVELGFYHMKGMKKDRGVNNYDLNSTAHSLYQSEATDIYRLPHIISWKRAKKLWKILSGTPDPDLEDVKLRDWTEENFLD